MSNLLRKGDKVLWAGTWRKEAFQEATVTSIELCERKGEKYGVKVDAVSWDSFERICVDLDNGHWAYGYQLKPIE